MCLILFAYQQHPRYRLVLAANRDEFYARPTAPAAFWDDDHDVLGGRDLVGGGTWMGLTRTGRFAALTNVREPHRHRPEAPTRGLIVADFLRGTTAPRDYLEHLRERELRYNGYNVLLGTPTALWWYSNRGGSPRALTPGLYGLSNDLLDTPWPKVERGKKALQQALDRPHLTEEAVLDRLLDAEIAPDDELPRTGVDLEWERKLSPPFIVTERYGTRVSTLVTITYDGHVAFLERPVAPTSDRTRVRAYRFQLT
ncbi:MAG: NRDE family protein [Bacteroidota bacterium]